MDTVRECPAGASKVEEPSSICRRENCHPVGNAFTPPRNARPTTTARSGRGGASGCTAARALSQGSAAALHRRRLRGEVPVHHSSAPFSQKLQGVLILRPGATGAVEPVRSGPISRAPYAGLYWRARVVVGAADGERPRRGAATTFAGWSGAAQSDRRPCLAGRARCSLRSGDL